MNKGIPSNYFKIWVPKAFVCTFGGGALREDSIIDTDAYYVGMFDNQLQTCFTFSNID